MNAFHITRWRLTLWYMVISCLLLTMFTIAALIAERQAFMAVEELVHSQSRGIVFNAVLQAEIDNFQQDFARRLIAFDLLMLIVAGLASYILSGRTLQPIERMVKEQAAFAADASHELRTPLANIDMEIEARRRSGSAPKGQDAELLNSIQAEVQRMRGLVTGLLHLVRSHEVAQLPARPVNITDICQDVVNSVQARLTQKKLKLALKLPQEAITIKGQDDEFRQVVLILLDNAILYTPNQGVITINLEAQSDKAQLTVHNTGPGIPSPELPRIFERFYRGEGVKQPGSGLGLAIARVIVERYDGQIAVASQPKQGTTFRLRLPLV